MNKTRKELMQELNNLLGTKHNFNRINLLDLERLVNAVYHAKKKATKIEVIAKG